MKKEGLFGILLVLFVLPGTLQADPISDHEKIMKDIWIGDAKEHLVADYGPPLKELKIPGTYNNLYIMIYPRYKIRGNAVCSDTFTVKKETDIILNFHCR